MDMQSAPQPIRTLYPCTRIRGKRITRWEEQAIGKFELSTATAWEIGTNNIGVFVGGCPSFFEILRRLRRLESPSGRPYWVLVPSTKKTASVIMDHWCSHDQTQNVPTAARRARDPIQHHNIILATPEQLRRVDPNLVNEIAGIILIDKACIVYQARGDTFGRGYRNDRPQYVVNFRNQLNWDGWMPPFFLLTTKPAKSVNTHSVARAFCLDAFWFVDGRTLSCGTVSSGKSDSA